MLMKAIWNELIELLNLNLLRDSTVTTNFMDIHSWSNTMELLRYGYSAVGCFVNTKYRNH